MPGLRIRRATGSIADPPRRKSRPSSTSGGRVRCRIPTLIKRATGTSERYALSSVRALPLRFRGGRRSNSDPAFRHNVVLQASDGHQAVCVLTEGAIEEPTLIPAEVLPTRQADRDNGVDLDDNVWRSRDGQEAPSLDAEAEFPAIGSALPEVKAASVAVAISVDRLRRIAAGLGTDTVTLMVPAPGRVTTSKRAQPKSQATVTDAIAVCPAGKNDTDGVAVLLPVTCERSHAYYNRVREAIVKAEQTCKRKTRRRSAKSKKEVAA